MARLTRIIAVTAGLIVVGAILGAVAGALAIAVAVALTESVANAADPQVLGFAAVYGAVIGAVAASAAGWLALRRVPLWRAVAWTTAGAVGGGVAGWLVAAALRARFGGPLLFLGDEVGFGVVGAVCGFAVATVVLRRQASLSRP